MIQQVLEEAGNYAVVSAASGGEAVQLVKTEKPALCILDADLKDVPLPQLGDTLRDMQPGVLLVLIPPDDDPEEELPEMDADGYLSKPFYLPDLVSTVEEVLQGRKVAKPVASSAGADASGEELEQQAAPSYDGPAPEWLKDVDAAARHLTRLTLESASQAALITQGSEIWAYAGELDRKAADELASTVAHYWADDGGADLARYVRLDATAAITCYMLPTWARILYWPWLLMPKCLSARYGHRRTDWHVTWRSLRLRLRWMCWWLRLRNSRRKLI